MLIVYEFVALFGILYPTSLPCVWYAAIFIGGIFLPLFICRFPFWFRFLFCLRGVRWVSSGWYMRSLWKSVTSHQQSHRSRTKFILNVNLLSDAMGSWLPSTFTYLMHPISWDIFRHYHYILLILFTGDGFRLNVLDTDTRPSILYHCNSSNGLHTSESDVIFLLQEIISNQLRHSVVSSIFLFVGNTRIGHVYRWM